MVCVVETSSNKGKMNIQVDDANIGMHSVRSLASLCWNDQVMADEQVGCWYIS